MKKPDCKAEIMWFAMWIALITIITIAACLFFVDPARAEHFRPAPPSANNSALLASIRSGAWQAHPSLGVLVTVSPADSSSTGEATQPLQIAFPIIAQEASPCGSAYKDNESIVIESIGWRYVIDTRLRLDCVEYNNQHNECLSWKRQ